MWTAFQALRREGFGNAWRRRRIAPRILDTSPIITRSTDGGPYPCETHVLLWDQDLLPALWAIKSFYATAECDWPLYLHQGGPLSTTSIQRIKQHLPGARLITSRESDARVEALLSAEGRANLLEARRQAFMLRKLIDPVVFGTSPRMLLLDTDVLFFKQPREILEAAMSSDQTALFNRDEKDWYSVSRELALRRLEIELPARVNAGLAVVARSSIDLAAANEWFAEMPELLSCPWLTEQTIQALFAGRNGLRYLPETYALSKAAGLTTPEAAPLCAKHYVSHPRPLFYQEGIPQLIHTRVIQGL